jgi:hypothetical protein
MKNQCVHDWVLTFCALLDENYRPPSRGLLKERDLSLQDSIMKIVREGRAIDADFSKFF